VNLHAKCPSVVVNMSAYASVTVIWLPVASPGFAARRCKAGGLYGALTAGGVSSCGILRH